MAYTIPTGYTYYDASASKIYTAKQVFNGTPADGDTLNGTGSNIQGISYSYRSAHTVNPSMYSGTPLQINISAGWSLSTYNCTGAATSYTLLATIAGKPVVKFYVPTVSYDNSKITSYTIPAGSKIEYLNLGGSKVVSLKGTIPNTVKYFYACNALQLTSVPSLSNCISWTYGMGTFQDCVKLVTAPALPNSLTNIKYMFRRCSSLTTAAAIPQSAVEATDMYRDCVKLTSAPANNSNNLTSLINCFYGCTALTSASNFTIKGTNDLNASNIFYNCINLQTPPNITTVKNLNDAFYNCEKLTTLPNSLPSSVCTADRMCYNCKSLTNFPDMSQTNLTSLNYAFYGCSSLTSINSNYFPATNPLSLALTFFQCTSLETVPLLHEGISSLAQTFSGCTNLVAQNIYIPTTVTTLYKTFYNCPNLCGVVTLNRTVGAISDAFGGNSTNPIIITGINGYTDVDISTMGSRVYKELEIQPNQIEVVRCSDTAGTLDDEGEYVYLKAKFNSIIISNSDVYVPKVYISNDQQTPQTNWKLTNLDTGTTTIVNNSTDISATRILAGDLISNGQFESYFLVGDNEVLNYTVFIGTSADNVYQLSNNNIITQTKYWGGKPGSAVFTSSTFIFDATPDGKSFKIGGPINDNSTPPETGFIVGNAGIINISDQYSSTFNGPVTFNSNFYTAENVNINIGLDSTIDSEDFDLYTAISNLNWTNDVIV